MTEKTPADLNEQNLVVHYDTRLPKLTLGQRIQIPIIGWEKRYITTAEGLKLQSLTGLKLPTNDNAAFKALGNAVNSHIVELIAKQLIINPVKNLPLENANKINGYKVKQTLSV